MNKLNALAAATVLASLTAAAANAGPVAPQPGKDKCYGISLAGKNDCKADPRGATMVFDVWSQHAAHNGE